VAQLEAICSLATFAYENPDYAFADLEEGPLHFEAAGLGHPLLPRSSRVLNDVSLPSPGHVLLVPGSNMSGKSTLLRSIGLSAVLGMSGAPSCCNNLRMSPCAVRSSMRVEDSVRGGVSRFYAELQQIKRVCETAKQRPVLFLLDEIFHGTNSRERHIGARSVVRRLIEHGAVGAVSTHDVALAALTEVLEDKIHLVHFQEDIRDGEMVFDYKLRQGVVKSGNALRWMRHVGLDVDLDDPAAVEGGEPPVSAT
jgi:DNA mismatch repair ATPase MutS